MTTITVAFERQTTNAQGEVAGVAGEDLWIAPDAARRDLGWEQKSEGLCRAALCVPLPAAKATRFVREDGAINLAELARYRGQPIVHSEPGDVWVFGDPGEARAAAKAGALAPDFTLPDLDGVPHALADARGKKIIVAAWASW